MKSVKLSFIAILFLFILSHNVFSNTLFTLHVIETVENTNKVKTLNEYDINIDLGNNYFSFIKNNTKFIYDFNNRCIIEIDLKSKVFIYDSLFSDIGFRVAELKNRLFLGKVLAAGNIKDNPMIPVLNEHLFSLLQEDNKSEISIIEKDGIINFSSSGKDLLAFTISGTKVSPRNKNLFVKFIRYLYGGHPKILSKMEEYKNIPASLTFFSYNLSNETYTITSSRVESTPDYPYSLEGFKPMVGNPSDTAIISILSKIKYSTDINFEEYLNLLILKATNSFKNEKYLETALIYLEYNLASGKPLPQSFHEQKDILLKNESVQKLFKSLSPKSKEEAQEYLTNLQSLKKETTNYAHVIQIFEANTQTSLGNTAEAKKLFIEIIKTNPLIAGVYHDLGEIFYNGYEAKLAWRCWDFARKLAPEHRLFMDINEMEKKFIKENPEFFNIIN